jgi:hypothetical protein
LGWGGANKAEGHNEVCALSSLVDNFVSSSSYYGGDCIGQQSTLPWSLSLQGDKGVDNDGCSSGQGRNSTGQREKTEGHDVFFGLSLSHDVMSSFYYDDNDGGGQHGTLLGSPSLQGDDGDDDDGCSSGLGVMQ